MSLYPTARALVLTLTASGIVGGALAAPPPSEAPEPQRIANEMDAFLWKHVLTPRFPRCIDREHGGFHQSYARDWSPLPDGNRFIVYESRVVWTAATVARLRPDSAGEFLPYVRHGVRYMADVMWDREHGGFHTFVDLSGQPALNGPFAGRPAYGQAFAIYGLAAAHAATGDAEPLELARRAWRFVEDHYREEPGYLSAVQTDGRPFPKHKDGAAPIAIEGPVDLRTMNDHIHLLEAYAALLRSWPDPELRRRTGDLLDFVRDRLIVEPGSLYFALLPDGRPVPGPVSFGHDVETAFLLLEAEEALGREPQAATLRVARLLVDHALARGFDPERGQLFEAGRAYGLPCDRSIEWWGQFEAVNAFLLMDGLYGQETDRYRTAFSKAWALTRDALADPQHPGVCQRIDEDGQAECGSKSNPWFASYHTARALLLSADRLRER